MTDNEEVISGEMELRNDISKKLEERRNIGDKEDIKTQDTENLDSITEKKRKAG